MADLPARPGVLCKQVFSDMCGKFTFSVVSMWVLFWWSGLTLAISGDWARPDYACDIVPDRRIDGLDLIVLSRNMAECSSELTHIRSDIDGDGCITVDDLYLFGPHFGRVITVGRPLLASFCYYWYSPGQQNWAATFATPLLGYYSSRSSMTIQLQNEWKHRSGIEVDIISWDGATAIDNFRHGYLDSGVAGYRRFFYLYETEMRFGSCAGADMGAEGSPTEQFDVFVADFLRMAEDFSRANYFRIDGRPVIMIWVTGCYQGDFAGALDTIREEISTVFGQNIFIIGDELIFGGWDDPVRLARIRLFDGVASYGFYNPYYATEYGNQMSDGYLELMESSLRQWLTAIDALRNGLTNEKLHIFLPAFPGFQIMGNLPPLHATVEQFSRQLFMLAGLAAEFPVEGIFVMSFNEHYEDTAVEPTIDRGFERLRAIRSAFGLGIDYNTVRELSCHGDMVDQGHYLISRYECPNRSGLLPWTWLNWYQAAGICINSGYRLCTSEEWTDACDGLPGPGGLLYPYGNQYQPGICNEDNQSSAILPSGSMPECKSGTGVYDLSGNVGEFVRDAFPGDPVRMMNKGGTFAEVPSKTTCAAMWRNTPDYSFPDYGFRCCQDKP